MKKLIVMSMLAMSMMFVTVGCGNTANSNTEVTENQDNNDNKEDNNDSEEVSDLDSVAMLTVLWDNTAEENKFASFGGDMANPVENAPGQVNLEDENMLVNTLLVPQDMIANVSEAGSLVHMMNSNTFTGVSLKLDGMDASEAANAIRDNFKSYQFVCGIPEKIKIATCGDTVIYAYGATDLVDDFVNSVDNLKGASIVVDELY